MYSPVRAVSHPRVSACEFEPDGETFYTGSRAGTIRVWSVTERENLSEWVAHDDGVEDIAAVSPGELVTAGTEGTVKHWATNSGECLNTFTGHGDVVSSVAVGSGGEVVVSGSYDGTVRRWRLGPSETGSHLKQFQDKVVAVAAHPTEPVAAYGGIGEDVHLWEYESDSVYPRLGSHDTAVMAAEFSNDGTTLITADHSGGIRWWETTSWSKTSLASPEASGEYSLAWSDDGVFVATDTGITCFSSAAVVQSVLDVDIGVHAIAAADSGSHLVAATFDGTIRLYEAVGTR